MKKEKIQLGSLLLSGIFTGVLINIGLFLLHQFLRESWDSLRDRLALGEPGTALFLIYNILSFMLGLISVWLFVMIRPVLGNRPRTALISGVVVWFLVWCNGFGSTGLAIEFPADLMIITIVGGLIIVPLSTLAGSKLYPPAVDNQQ